MYFILIVVEPEKLRGSWPRINSGKWMNAIHTAHSTGLDPCRIWCRRSSLENKEAGIMPVTIYQSAWQTYSSFDYDSTSPRFCTMYVHSTKYKRLWDAHPTPSHDDQRYLAIVRRTLHRSGQDAWRQIELAMQSKKFCRRFRLTIVLNPIELTGCTTARSAL